MLDLCYKSLQWIRDYVGKDATHQRVAEYCVHMLVPLLSRVAQFLFHLAANTLFAFVLQCKDSIFDTQPVISGEANM